ncbi:MAG: hypothetical protein CL903_01595 [Dehalococcoidia bacterium]|nr:hypothetical protein [Dehalococcoidia bacterium]MQG09503.1 MFS transporter [SAR202 cluster bacterium]|tara:strand:- start:2508 stop:3659 length:1152 start_codon:yes stop_codon:yes gene_type:complete
MLVAMQLRLLASTQWLFEETGSAASLGLLGVIQLGTMPLIIYGGLLADIFDRKKLMIFTQGFSFVALLFLTIVAFTNTLAPWMIFVTTGLTAIVNMLGNSARPALLPRVIKKQNMTKGITIQTASFQIGQIVSPLIFMLFYVQFGVSVTFLVGTIFGLISMVSPALIMADGKPDQSTKNISQFAALKEGAVYVFKHPILPGLYLLDVGVTILSFYRMLFPLFSQGLYGMGAEGTGLLASANALGGVLGSLVVLVTEKIKAKGKIVLYSTMAYAIGLILFGLNPIFWLGLIIVAILGATDSVGMTMRQTIVQLTTPDRLIGRASSAHSFAAQSANNIGQMEVAFLAVIIGASGTMIVGGALSIFIVIAIWIKVPGIRNYRYYKK